MPVPIKAHGAVLAVAWLLFASMGSSQAQSGRIYEGVTWEEMTALLKRAGYTSTVSYSGGKPKLTIRNGRFRWFVGFYGCNLGQTKRRHSVQFYAGYRMRVPVSLARLNLWNSKKRYARGYRQIASANIVFVEFDMPFVGVTERTLEEQLKMFHRQNRAFRAWIGFQ